MILLVLIGNHTVIFTDTKVCRILMLPIQSKSVLVVVYIFVSNFVDNVCHHNILGRIMPMPNCDIQSSFVLVIIFVTIFIFLLISVYSCHFVMLVCIPCPLVLVHLLTGIFLMMIVCWSIGSNKLNILSCCLYLP